jgi:hypothetical protein
MLRLVFLFSISALFSVGSAVARASTIDSVSASASTTLVTKCLRADAAPGLPPRIEFKIISENQIEAWAFSDKGLPAPTVRLESQEIPNQPGLALFNVGGQLMVSGDAKLLITSTALKYRNVGRLLFTNRTSGELSTYHCR